MGYQLVAAALQPEWGRVLTSTEHLILLIMCQVALDDETPNLPARTYWGGSDYIVLKMRGDVPDPGSPELKKSRELVRRALRKLEKVGAVGRARIAVNGLRAEYVLTVNAPQLPVDNSPPRAMSGPHESGPQALMKVGLRPS